MSLGPSARSSLLGHAGGIGRVRADHLRTNEIWRVAPPFLPPSRAVSSAENVKPEIRVEIVPVKTSNGSLESRGRSIIIIWFVPDGIITTQVRFEIPSGTSKAK